ncbi:MAG: HDIG domain-containing protein [Deltaproteobacteria bacterium]|jgi:putative nucleotidyltransferase with HDIG domain|nr:HDIG domain-containing protein [Deltaproteobacteria bacterium]
MRPKKNRVAFFLVLIAIALLTVGLSRPTPDNYEVGKKAGHTFMCDRDMEVVDEDATVLAQALAASQAIPLFELDYRVNAESMEEFRRVFDLGRVLTHSGLAGIPENFQETFCGLFVMDDCPDTLAKVWQNRFDQKLENMVSLLTSEIMSQGLMDESDFGAGFIGRDIEISRVWAGNSVVKYSSFLTVPRAKTLVDARASLLSIGSSQDFENLLSALTLGLLRPNLKLDRAAWENRQSEAAAKVKVVHFLKAGEIIVREGDLITPLAGLKLKALTNRDTQGGLSIRPSLGLIFLLLVFLAVSQTLIHLERDSSEIDYREMILISLLILWIVILSWWSGYLTRGLLREVTHIEARTMFMAMPFPAAAMLGAIFLGLRRTVYICFLGAFLGAIATSQVNTLSAFIYICNGCMVSIWGLRHISDRARFIPSSLLAALVNCLTMMALTLTDGNLLSTQFLYNLMAAAISGLLSGILASGLVTLIEATLGLTTNLKLMELGNLNRPLLRELMLAAPGTYHHSVIVGSMVEAAAEAIRANPHLARVGAYYHDIGKISKPLYFIENQLGENKHETLTPTMSALVLVGHVKEGAEMARKDNLPKAVIDIVEQHHGTSLMTYFYHKAKENRGQNSAPINESDFRYPGPKPTSKEAGLVMLADICEAATRSLTEPTPNKIQELVRTLINRVFDDGQLDASELVLKDVTETIRVFNNILVGIYHHRIAYPMTDKAAQSDQAARSKVIYGQLTSESAKRITH